MPAFAVHITDPEGFDQKHIINAENPDAANKLARKKYDKPIIIRKTKRDKS